MALLDVAPILLAEGGGEMEMTEREQVIAELRYLKRDCLEGSATDQTIDKAIALLEEQTPKTMTLEEAKAYLASDDQDKNPLWVQWATSSVKGGWVLAHTVEDLMRRYESIYRTHWVLWTQKPSEEQRKAVIWDA